MFYRNMISAVALAAMAMPTGDARAFDETKYPDWKGAWDRMIIPGISGQPSHDPTNPWGFGQQAPLTPEYRAVLQASIADQLLGGLGNYPTAWCLPAGMPLMMVGFRPLEFIITPDVTYILIG